MRNAVVVALVTAWGCSSTPRTKPVDPQDRAIINQHAFARLYGVVRWFHPSDEAAAIDWNRFASAGVARVRGAASPDELAAALTELVRPIAPTVIIGPTSRSPAPPAAPTGELTWWQHTGPGLVGVADPYISKRRGRPAPSFQQGKSFVVMSRVLEAKPYRGQRIRLSARVAATDGGRGQLWLRVDRPGGVLGFFDNMDGREITASDWTVATIEGTVADDAENVVFGALMAGKGSTKYDDFRIEVAAGKGAWTAVPLDNPGFDLALDGWHGDAAAHPDRAGGTVAMLAPGAMGPPVVDEPFDDRPRADEVTAVELGDGLTAWVPLVLASRDGHTQPAGDPSALAALLAAPADPAADHVADLVVTWNVFAHFYPYLDVIGEDWDAVLDVALRDAADDATADDHATTLRRLVARAKDGHGWARIDGPLVGAPPIRFGWVEDRVVVLASDDASVHRGDVVITVDGKPAGEVAIEKASLVSGSPQWARARGVGELAMGPIDGEVALQLDRAGVSVDVKVRRGKNRSPEPFDHPALGEIEPGVWYVDMERAEMSAIDAAMPKLAAARVVVDMRGYPNNTSGILTHIIKKPDTVKWMHVAHVVRPFQHGITSWEDYGWDLQAAAPRLDRVVFITGPRAISYAESVMGYAQYEGIPIVGAASAGTNGNVRTFDVPTGATIAFTGMRVTRHDGGQHHLIGVPPTIPAAPTIAGVAAGRDEVLEAAIAAVKKQ
jgi:hypothetical protein